MGEAFSKPTPTALLAEKWVDDKDRNACYMDSKFFGFFERRHHCRCCGEIFCSVCSFWSCVLPELGWGTSKQRVCGYCFEFRVGRWKCLRLACTLEVISRHEQSLIKNLVQSAKETFRDSVSKLAVLVVRVNKALEYDNKKME